MYHEVYILITVLHLSARPTATHPLPYGLPPACPLYSDVNHCQSVKNVFKWRRQPLLVHQQIVPPGKRRRSFLIQ